MSKPLKGFKLLSLNIALASIFTSLSGCHWGSASSSNSSGSGGSGPVAFTISVTPVSGAPNKEILTLTNTGSDPITNLSASSLQDLTLSAGPDAPPCTAVGILDPLPAGGSTTIDPGGSCTYYAQSSDNAPPGSSSGTVTITGSDLGANPYDVNLNVAIHGYLYAGSNTQDPGVFRTDGSSGWSVVGSTGVPGTINDLKADPTGNIYAASGAVDNVYKWDGANTWTAVSTDGTPPPTPSAIGFDSNGNLYAGTFGFYELAAPFDTSSWSELSPDTPSVAFRAIAFDVSDNVYIGDNGGGDGVQVWTGSSFSALGSNPPENTYNLAFNEGTEGTLYAAANDGVYSYDAGTWTKTTGSPSNAKTLLFANSTTLYAGFTNGAGADIQKDNGSSWSTVGTSIPNNIYGLAIDSNGTLYAGANQGGNDVYKLDPPYTGAWTTVASGAPTAPANVYALVLASTLNITAP